MTTTGHRTTRLGDLAQLRSGDTVEARRYDTVLYRGQVDGLVAKLGILWLRHGPWQERVLPETTES
ncbi:hypothetical protein [Kocuria arenosa]|uniref:hypothetical protein n=1 Tax=Kocuria arenosa TaxID=3071446 RepID=UPI0034D70278